ncbi:alpha/beta hydrolase [Bosea caraganae]|uniref:Alpha/beta hydrolase n=1 Tax=Bosea caraganae TaxID=2763117 RepID=A0A370LB00_9HYPH|nr:alpha/beta hydrolase [Bosea caraganae]RDJ21892.1 alpha/beta hydrolase [Bosea caraganae]RDJ28076.1 alpha/beta hydrolase [Bosea caraganae]
MTVLDRTATSSLVRRHTFTRAGVTIEVLDQGEGPAVFVLPSLGRGAEDYDAFAGLLADRGLRTLRPQPRGIGLSTGPLDGLTMHDLAGDVALAVESLGLAPAIIAGHAFGNFVARMLATIRPELVGGVAMLAGSAGMLPSGESPYDPEVLAALARCGDLSLGDETRLEALRIAFFAPGNDAGVWLGGWHPHVKAAQRVAEAATPVSVYFAGGEAPILEVQAARDTIAAPRFAHVLREQLGERVTTVVIPDAGHALIPEKPVAVADALAGWIVARTG